MIVDIEWLQALEYLCGLQPIAFEVDVEPDSSPGFDRQLMSCVIAVSWRHFVVLVFVCIFGLILVPTRLGLAGIGSSTPLQGSTRLSRRFCMENLRWRFKNNFRCGRGSMEFCVESDGEVFRWRCSATGVVVVGSENIS